MFSTLLFTHRLIVKLKLSIEINLLHTLVAEHVGSWDLKLSITKFAYNSSVNRTIRNSLHEIVYDFWPRQSIDLIPMTDHYNVSESASSFVTHMHKLQKEINNRIAQSVQR